MDTHEQVDRIEYEKFKKENQESLLKDANENIDSFTLSVMSFGFRKGIKVGFVVGVVITSLVVLIINLIK